MALETVRGGGRSDDGGGASGRGVGGREATPAEVEELRKIADHLATSGGDVARRMLQQVANGGLDSESKSSSTDPVTVIDISVEAHLREQIASLRPRDRVLGEEGGETSSAAESGHTGPVEGVVAEREAEEGVDRVRWVVDPVDGTVNLLYGIPFTAVSVAAEFGGVVVAGAVHNIVTRETWTAGLGCGALLRHPDGTESELRASGCEDLSLALVGTGFSYDAAIRAEQGRALAALIPRIRDIRRCGSAALDLCMVATGRLDAYFERCLKPWDFAAGALVAAEAGAVVSVSSDDAVPTTAAAPGVAERFHAALVEATG